MPTVERLLAWYRLTSSVGAVVALVVANAIPLVGVLFLGWNVWNILVVYWLENGVVGAFNVLKMARAEGSGDGMGLTMNGRLVTGVARATLIPFFVIHYGLFWFVHGIFVLTLPLFTGMFQEVGQIVNIVPLDPSQGMAPAGTGQPPFAIDVAADRGGFDLGTVAFAAVALAISHGLSYWWNFVRGGEYRTASAAGMMFAPYGRLVALHVTILLGAMAIISTGAPAAAVAILVAVKTLLDVGFHLAEHRRAGPTGRAGTVAGPS